MLKIQKIADSWIQFVYDQVFTSSYSTRFARLKARIFNKLFYLILKVGDPLIKHNIGCFTLLLPFSHQLPFILKTYPQYSSNLARIAKEVKQKYADLTFIDIGANIGDSIALLRKEAEFPILCIEGDEQFLSVLEKNATLFPEVYVLKTYLGEFNKIIHGVSVKKGGTGHLQEAPVGENVIEIKKLSDILHDYPSFRQSKMIKIDTDGFDCKIIRGAVNFLQTAKPVIFFEYDPFFLAQQEDDGISIFKDLMKLNYKRMLIYNNFGDFMLSSDLDNYRLIEEIHLYFSGRMSHQYCDICVFHAEDSDLFETARYHEIQFVERFRNVHNVS